MELVCVGTELLMGKLNTHGAYFSGLLEDAGLPLARETTVSDDPKEMARLFKEVWDRSDVVLATGGLGPTFDDVTRDVWARVLGRKLVFRRDLLAAIVERFQRRGTPMPPANRRQAYILDGARPLENANGTAPGQLLEAEGKILVLLPGPGREMKPMVERFVLPFLGNRFPSVARKTRVWRLFGRPESAVDQQLRKIFNSKGGASWGILAQDGVVDVKMTASGTDPRRVEKIVGQWDARMRRAFGKDIFGNEGDTLESVVGSLLKHRGKTLATAESCTGGGLAQKLTNVPGSSEYYWGGVVVYDNTAKRKLLGVGEGTLKRFGAVSAETAREMAQHLRRKARADVALSITGIAGPAGGTADKPVGRVYIALAAAGSNRVWEMNFLGDRALIRNQSALWALNSLRLELQRHPEGF